MGEENKHIIYSAADIKKYLEGKMLPAEMHAIEMAALDDPLLSEAIEGYAGMEQKDWSKELATLQQSIINKEEAPAPVIPLYKKNNTRWWKAAAAILVLGILAITAYIITSKNEVDTIKQLATNKTTEIDSSIANATQPASAHNGIIEKDTSQPLIAKLDKNTNRQNSGSSGNPAQLNTTINTTPTESEKQQPIDDAFVYKPSAAPLTSDSKTREEVAGNFDADKSTPQLQEVALSNSKAANNAAAFNNITVNKPGQNNAKEQTSTPNKNNDINFYGQVVSADNNPVSFANINIPQSNKTVSTDAHGMFAIASPDSMLLVTVTSPGFNTQAFSLQNTNANQKIVLEPNGILSETTVATTRAVTKKQQPIIVDSATITANPDAASPAIGWAAYQAYLTNNLILPEEAKKKNIHGEVEVLVKLKNNGEISTVQISKPLCPGCDAEAIRLVNEGPKWEVKNNKNKSAKVKVKF